MLAKVIKRMEKRNKGERASLAPFPFS
jgi:hypothetical protein